MNRSGLNTVTLNSAPLDVVQRVVLAMVAVASSVVHARTIVRNVFDATGRAVVGAGARLLIRASIATTPQAAIGLGGQDLVRGRVDAQGRASVALVATVFERDEVRDAFNALALGAVTVNVSKTLRRKPVSATAQAVGALTGRLYYTQHKGIVNAQAQALAVVDFETRKQIPYDEDAPDERALVVSEDSRLVMVA